MSGAGYGMSRRASNALRSAYEKQARWLIGLANLRRAQLGMRPLVLVKGGDDAGRKEGARGGGEQVLPVRRDVHRS